MAVYWLSFTIDGQTVGGKDDGTRRDALYNAVQSVTTKWWLSTTSFMVFETAQNLSSVAAKCKAAVAPTVDLVLIRAMDSKNAAIIGKVDDQDIFDLIPYLRTL